MYEMLKYKMKCKSSVETFAILCYFAIYILQMMNFGRTKVWGINKEFRIKVGENSTIQICQTLVSPNFVVYGIPITHYNGMD